MEKLVHTGIVFFLSNRIDTKQSDIKPDNIFLCNIDGHNPVVRVGDLGASKYFTYSNIL
jgi:serine/threonine protein kinase